MISQVANLVRWEWFKLRRRWMPWILLIVIVAFSQMPVWGGFFDYQGRMTDEVIIQRWDPDRVFKTGLTCAEVRAGQQPTLPEGTGSDVIREVHERCSVEAVAQAKGIFTLPGSLAFPFSMAQVFGMLLLAILTASMLGSDYSWGTLRTVLVRGTGRWQYLMAKLVLIALFVAGVWVVVGALTVLNSLLAMALAPETSPEVAEWLAAHSAEWSNMFILVGRAFVAILPYLALATFVTVLTISLVAGIAVALGYYFVEAIAAGLIINLIPKLDFVADYFLVRNTTAWMLGSKDQVTDAWVLTGPFGFGQYPTQVHAIYVLLAYMFLFLALSFWSFNRRDVVSASGG